MRASTWSELPDVAGEGQVGEYPNAMAFPGGHPEPEDVVLPASGREDAVAYAAAVRDELFDSVVREAIEEVGLAPADLGEPRFLGIVRRKCVPGSMWRAKGRPPRSD